MNIADVKYIYISRAETAHTEDYITKVFKRLQIGEIEELQLIPKTNEKKHNYFGVRIKIQLNPKSKTVQQMMEKFELNEQAQIQHNPRYHWNVVRFVVKDYKEMIPAPFGFVNPTTTCRDAYETISPYATTPCVITYVSLTDPEMIRAAINQMKTKPNPDDKLFEIRMEDWKEQQEHFQNIKKALIEQGWDHPYYNDESYEELVAEFQ
jgi:hypothetical protein